MPVTQAFPIFVGVASGSVRTQATALTQRRPYFSFAQAAFDSAWLRAPRLSRPFFASRESDAGGKDEVVDVAAAVLLDVVDDVPAALTEAVEDLGYPDLSITADQVVERPVSTTVELSGEEERVS